MKTIYYNIIFLLCMIPAISLANQGDKNKGKYSKEKSMTKEFSVDKNALLKITNDYGNLDITSWDEDRIVMEIKIKVSGNDEEKVIEKLKSINVKFEATSQMVSAKTVFGDGGSSWWDKISDGWGRSHLKMEINYTVKVPETNKVDLNNDYGSITLDKISGHAKVNCDYGQIILGELLGEDNSVTIDYTHNSTIKYMKSGRINADYSDFTLEKGEKIILNADYSQSILENVKDCDYNCDYGGLKILNVEVLEGNGDYLDTNIGTVKKSLIIQSDYGSIDIKNLEPSVKNVSLRTDYTGIRIGYDKDLDFDFIIKTSYGGINLPEDVTILKKDKGTTNKEYEGYRGNKNSGCTIDIGTSYGGVKLFQN